jgi:hypothetical protein
VPDRPYIEVRLVSYELFLGHLLIPRRRFLSLSKIVPVRFRSIPSPPPGLNW